MRQKGSECKMRKRKNIMELDSQRVNVTQRQNIKNIPYEQEKIVESVNGFVMKTELFEMNTNMNAIRG